MAIRNRLAAACESHHNLAQICEGFSGKGFSGLMVHG